MMGRRCRAFEPPEQWRAGGALGLRRKSPTSTLQHTRMHGGSEASRAHRVCGGCDCWPDVFIAHSLVQVSLNMTMPLWSALLVRQARPAEDFFTSVELIAHSLVQTSRNITAPVSRYSLVRQGVVAATAGVTARGATVVGGSAGGRGRGATATSGSAARRGRWTTMAGGSGRRFCARLGVGSSSSLAFAFAALCEAGALELPAKPPRP